MKILVVTSRLDRGGVERQLTLLVRGLLEAGCRPAIACLGRVGQAAATLRSWGVPIHLGSERPSDFRWLLGLSRTLSAVQPDLIHTWDRLGNRLGRAVALCTADVPVVATAHRPAPGEAPWLRWGDRLLARTTVRWVIPSPGAFRYWEARGIAPNAITVIEPAVELFAEAGPSPLELRRSARVPVDAPLIVAVGRLDRDYAFRDAVWSFDILKYLQPRAVLMVLGDGPDRPRLERFACAIHVADRIRFLGRVSDPLRWLSNADVVWAPNAVEDVPHALLEALALGKPVVVPELASVAALFEDGRHVLRTPLGDKPALAQATQRLLEDRCLAEKLGDEARRLVRHRFSTAKMVEKYLAVYRSVLGRETTSGGGTVAPGHAA